MNKRGKKGWLAAALFAVLSVAAVLAVYRLNPHPARDRKQESAAGSGFVQIDYTDRANWAFYDTDPDKAADLFIICPTVAYGSADQWNMELPDEEDQASFTGALNMELGIYDEVCSVYAPYYRQATLYAFDQGGQTLETATAFAYDDVAAAFEQYLETSGENRPLVLAGFSQGSQLLIQLMKDYFDDQTLSDRLVAAYAIGWRLTAEECAAYPQLKSAQGELDTGVIISFNSEAEEITDSLMVPAGTKTCAINPLNWKTDSTQANAALNLGACFTKYDGGIEREIPALCGGYLDSARGTLKVTGISSKDYPPVLSLFEDGIYHLYDYQFFYRNLQQNVQLRLQAFQR